MQQTQLKLTIQSQRVVVGCTAEMFVDYCWNTFKRQCPTEFGPELHAFINQICETNTTNIASVELDEKQMRALLANLRIVIDQYLAQDEPSGISSLLSRVLRDKYLEFYFAFAASIYSALNSNTRIHVHGAN